jgi:localization factor PodJL
MSLYRNIFLVIFLVVLGGAFSGCVETLSQVKNQAMAGAMEEKADAAYENKNYATAFEQYKKAAQAGSPYGQFMLASMYRRGEGTRQDAKQYRYWIQQCAENGFPAANYLMGLELMSVDPHAALRHLEEAASREHGESMHLLGLMHAQGIGVPQSTSEALKWFRLAQAHGIQVDRESLSESGIRNYAKRMNRATPSIHSDSRTAGRQLVREIQQRLTDLGYAPGPIDGLFGGKTKSAIQAFQRAQGLQADGQATPQLLEVLKKSGK